MKATLLLFVVLMATIRVDAQTLHKVIFKFDSLATLKTFSIPKVKKGQFYQLVIEDINLNIYDVTIGKKDSSIKSEVKFPTFELIGGDIIKGVVDGIIPATFSKGGNLGIAFQKANALKNLKNNGFINIFSDSISNDQKAIAGLKGSLQLNDDEFSNYKEILEIINAEKVDKRKVISKEIATNQQTIINLLNSANPHFEKAKDVVDQLSYQTNAYYEGLGKEPKNGIMAGRTFKSSSEVIKSSDQYRDSIRQTRTHLESLESNYKKFKESDPEYAKLYEDDEIKKQDAALKTDITNAKDAISKILEKIDPAKISEYITTIIHLENNKVRNYYSLLLQNNGDIGEFTITLTPKKAGTAPTHIAKYQLPKVDAFYVGLSGGFYYANFKHEAYSIRETPTSDSTSVFSLVDEEQSKGEIGFAALLHVGSKIGKSGLGAHGTIGPALSLANKPLPRLAFGGGISFGKKEGMISLDILCLAGNVNKKSNLYNPGFVPTVRPESVTVSKLALTWGLALGYIYKF